jgi:4'-phosphopantetheinyl transferase
VSADGIDVYWLECSRSDLPADNAWLGDEESCVFQSLHVPKRRDDWRLGRWTAKQAVAAYLELDSDLASRAALQIRPALSGVPEVFIHGHPAPVSISITHCNGIAACAVTGHGGAVGCDLEGIEPHSDAFLADYFVEREQELVARAPAADRPWLTTLLWSAKESALKALHEGLRLDTRSVLAQPELDGDRDGWRRVRAVAWNERSFEGWWMTDGRSIRTLVSDPSPNQPIVGLKSPLPMRT